MAAELAAARPLGRPVPRSRRAVATSGWRTSSTGCRCTTACRTPRRGRRDVPVVARQRQRRRRRRRARPRRRRRGRRRSPWTGSAGTRSCRSGPGSSSSSPAATASCTACRASSPTRARRTGFDLPVTWRGPARPPRSPPSGRVPIVRRWEGGPAPITADRDRPGGRHRGPLPGRRARPRTGDYWQIPARTVRLAYGLTQVSGTIEWPPTDRRRRRAAARRRRGTTSRAAGGPRPGRRPLVARVRLPAAVPAADRPGDPRPGRRRRPGGDARRPAAGAGAGGGPQRGAAGRGRARWRFGGGRRRCRSDRRVAGPADRGAASRPTAGRRRRGPLAARPRRGRPRRR